MTTRNNVVHAMPPPLPATTGAFASKRRTLVRWSLNDAVDTINMALYDNPDYTRFLYAVHDEQAVEGSCSFDTYAASLMIKQYAIDHDSPVKGEKPATIAKALGVVLRRYGEDRKTRRNTVAGLLVATEPQGTAS